MNNFSPNMLKTYQTCPKKYYYKYIQGINIPQSSTPFEKGKKIHALANYYLQKVDISRIQTALSVTEKEVWDTLLKNTFFQKECLKSEFQLTCKIDDFWIGGRLDAVVHDFENYYILDYKTGATPQNPEYDYQTMIYLLCLDKYLEKYESLSFVYLNLKEQKNHIIKFNPEIKQQYEQKIIQTCKTVTSDNTFNCNRNDCRHCEYSKLCYIPTESPAQRLID